MLIARWQESDIAGLHCLHRGDLFPRVANQSHRHRETAALTIRHARAGSGDGVLLPVVAYSVQKGNACLMRHRARDTQTYEHRRDDTFQWASRPPQ